MTDPPAADRTMSGAATFSPADALPEAAERGRTGALVCVVDDDEPVRGSSRALLESLGFAVMTYACGQDMLIDERRRQASCFIVDQHMPEMDGLTALGALHRDEPGALTILTTGRLDAVIAARAAALGGGAILEKPFSAARLLDVIRGRDEPHR